MEEQLLEEHVTPLDASAVYDTILESFEIRLGPIAMASERWEVVRTPAVRFIAIANLSNNTPVETVCDTCSCVCCVHLEDLVCGTMQQSFVSLLY